jgi:hypothetical protein
MTFERARAANSPKKRESEGLARLPPLFKTLDPLDPKEERIKSFTMLLPTGFGFLGAFLLPGLQTRQRGARFVSFDRKYRICMRPSRDFWVMI